MRNITNLPDLPRRQFFPILPERIKIETVEKFVANLHNKTEYFILIRNLKQTLNLGLVLKKLS